ncbi:hypothetical protein C8T65DRAFT_747435 [Cerioporus squamosus]|nr:hypothetical protein C8T65DRAFT_747435 [Cerioporus squamosus]
MTRLGLLKASPRTKEAAVTVLDLTVKGLEASKDTIAAAVPVPGLSVALSVAIELLKKIPDVKSNRNALVSLCAETTSLADTLKGLARAIEARLDEYPPGSPERARAKDEVFGSRTLIERVNKLRSELCAVCDEADTLSKRTSFRRFLHSARDTKAITDLRDRIAAAHRCFQIEGGVTTEAVIMDTLSKVKDVLTALKAAGSEVLTSHSRADDAHYLSAANTMKARFQQGTRDSIFNRPEEWEEAQYTDTGQDALLVCVLIGEAGTGKSTIASEFSKRLEERGRLGASFFFTRGVLDLDSPRKFFSTISSQLARSQSALRVPVVNAAREHLKSAALQRLEREFEDLVRKPLSALPSDHDPIFVVVDALDECTKEGPELVPTLLDLLISTAVQPGSPLRVFLTSRPEPHYIHKVFIAPHLKPHISILSIQDFRGSVDRDIKLLLSSRLAEAETSKKWSEANPSVVAAMVEKSDGLFVYARTAIDFVLGDVDDLLCIQERYQLLLTGDGKFGLHPLNTLYRTVLEGVFPLQSRYPQMQQRLKRALEYLVAVSEPEGISPVTLEKLTGEPTTESVPILNKLHSVVFFERDNADSLFRIIHATFREFLLDASRSGEACLRQRGFGSRTSGG